MVYILRFIFVALLATGVAGCTTPRLVLRNDFNSDTLRVSLIFSPEVPTFVSNELEDQFNNFIIKNNSSRKLKIQQVDGRDRSDLQIRVLATALVTPQQQSAGVVVSMLGLSLPILMASAETDFVIFFWYFPKAHSVLELSLHPEVNGSSTNPLMVRLQSPGFLKSPERQVSRHGVYFNDYLGNVINGLKKR
jgi:hypothetical protein